jgi:hypothetical protein
MKLSEIITNCNSYTEGVNYLLISKYEKPYIRIIKSSKQDAKYLGKDYYIFMVNNNDDVNLIYLQYYLMLNIELFHNYSFGFIEYGLSDNLSVEFINNIEINKLPSIEVQNKLSKVISGFYIFKLGLIYYKIEKLLIKCSNVLLPYTKEILQAAKASDLFEIEDIKLFFSIVSKGDFNEINYKQYINILRPDLINADYLIRYLYLYLNGALSNKSKHSMRDNNIRDFNISKILIPLYSIEDQLSVLEPFGNIHKKILKLKMNKKLDKCTLREILNSI